MVAVGVFHVMVAVPSLLGGSDAGQSRGGVFNQVVRSFDGYFARPQYGK